MARVPCPEVHIVGTVAGGEDFEYDNAFCKFEVVAGDHWEWAGGDRQGQTQVDYPSDGKNFVWDHPVDLHFFLKATQGWPRFQLQVGKLEEAGSKMQVFGYGVCFVPSSPGYHEVECPIWRPVGDPKQECMAFFLKTLPRLTSLHPVASEAKDLRQKLTCVPMGTVKLKLRILMRNFDMD